MISYEEFRANKERLKYRGSEEDIKKEYDVYVEACRAPTHSQIYNSSQSADGATRGSATIKPAAEPGLTIFFYILSVFSLVGGVVLAAVFWPGDPGYGNEWRTAAYNWSIIWMSAAIVEAGIFAAVGSALSYLNKIVINTAK